MAPSHHSLTLYEKSSVNILLNVSFCVPWDEENHTGLEQHESK